VDIHWSDCFWTKKFVILEKTKEQASVPITRNSTLSNWKNFVVKFRKDFETEFKGADETQSLSVLLLALAARMSTKTPGAHVDKNPKYRHAEKTCIEATECANDLFARTKAAMPKGLDFQLTQSRPEHDQWFASALNAIDKYNVATDPFALGYSYQHWRDGQRKSAQHDIQSANKQLDGEKLSAFTQVYTPQWVVDFILANAILPQLDDELASVSTFRPWQLDSEFEPISVQKVTLIDPAAGAGNFLIRAFDILLEQHRATGASSTAAAKFILERQLHGCDIDSTALSVAALALITRSGTTDAVLNGLALAHPDDKAILGSLSAQFPPEHPLSKKHNTVVTNPPYIGRKLMSRELKMLMKTRFPSNYHDLSAAFFERTLSLLQEGGRSGLITQASVLVLPSHSKLRQMLLDDHRLIAAVDAGPGVFPLQGGEKVNSAIFIVKCGQVQKPSDTMRDTKFFNIKNERTDKGTCLKRQIADNSAVSVNPEKFRRFQGCSFNYYIPDAVAKLLETSPHLDTVSDIRQGLATTDNQRFIKYAWQVPREDIGTIWFPYVKGAGGQRYHSPVRHLVNWQNDGEEIKKAVAERYPYLNGKTAWVVKNESFYFQEGLCFSFVNTRGIAIRKLPPNCIFDVGASAIFSSEDDYLLAYLNSSFMVALANSLNPTINYQVGDLKRLPLVSFDDDTVRRLARLAIDCTKIADELNTLLDPTSWFDPTLGSISPHPLFVGIEQLGFNAHREKFESLVREMMTNLQARQKNIDELVLNSIASRENWNTQSLTEVENWINEFNHRSPDELPANLAQLFIDNMTASTLLTQGNFSNRYRFKFQAWYDQAQTFADTAFEAYFRDAFRPRISKAFYGHPPEALLRW